MRLSPRRVLNAVATASPEIQHFTYERPIQIPEQHFRQTCLATSVVTLKPVIRGQFKTGHKDSLQT